MEKDNIKCFVCGHTMNKILKTANGGWGDYKINIDNVEAYHCEQCKESVYTNENVELIEKYSKAFEKFNRSFDLPDGFDVELCNYIRSFKKGKLKPIFPEIFCATFSLSIDDTAKITHYLTQEKILKLIFLIPCMDADGKIYDFVEVHSPEELSDLLKNQKEDCTNCKNTMRVDARTMVFTVI